MPHDKRGEKADSQPAAIEEEDATPCVPSGDMRDVHLANASRGTSLGASAQASTLDATTQRCRKLAEKYGLSSRETEVAEFIARGYTGPAIAEALFISENTMRTHNRRIYTKLGIHKKRELLMLIEQMGAEG